MSCGPSVSATSLDGRTIRHAACCFTADKGRGLRISPMVSNDFTRW